MPRCDYCGKEDAPASVDSPLGLAAWNQRRLDDQRTMLHTCGDLCTFSLGFALGEEKAPF